MIIPAAVAALLAYKLGSMQERKKRVYENNTKLLDEVFEPIMQEIEKGINPMYGYEGLSIQQANRIIGIVDSHSNIVEKRLKECYWGLKEELHMIECNGERCYYALDEKRKILDYIEYRINKLRKSVDRPYESNASKIRGRVRNRCRIICRRVKRLIKPHRHPYIKPKKRRKR